MDAAEKVGRWLEHGRGRIEENAEGQPVFVVRPANVDALVEKLRAVYTWLLEDALWSPVADLQFGAKETLGPQEGSASIGRDEAYSAFHLLPLLALTTGRTALLTGAPGRGKTTMATLMAVIGGVDETVVSRRVVRGHPQLTVADLLGGPLPRDLLDAEREGPVHVRWRKWLQEPVRIVDEYNRIPTKTQSALLSVLAEGVAEMYENEFQVPLGAFFMTANDAQGGGTFPVIEALRDRVDVVVRSPAIHSSHVARLAKRASSRPPAVPPKLRFSQADFRELTQAADALPIEDAAIEGLSAFVASLEFCRRASDDVVRMNKDVLHLSGHRVADVCNEDCPLDKEVHLCTQTERGVSVRALQAIVSLAKMLALFRQRSEVSLEDVRTIVPFVLADRLVPNASSPYFLGPDRARFLHDREGWIATLFARSLHQMAQYGEHREVTQRVVAAAQHATDLASGRKALTQLKRTVADLLENRELCAPVHTDVVELQGAHAALRRRLRSNAPPSSSVP